jgi:hypothetical protein
MSQHSTNGLAPSTVLRCAPALTVALQSGTPAYLRMGGRRVSCSVHVLPILDAFARPVPLSEALRALQARAPKTRLWIEMTSEILRLYHEGVLIADQATDRAIPPSLDGFGAPPIHVRMLNDRYRTEAYIDAISRVVRPGDVVVEIGTGTGILAAAAARAGAARVYAIEATEIAAAAERLFRDNGLSDQVKLLRGWSTQIELPEQADVLISEIIGDEPLAENVLEITADARSRFMKAQARYLPHRLRVLAVPITLPDDDLQRRTFQGANLANWQSWYGFRFDGLGAVPFERNGTLMVDPHAARKWRRLSEPVLLADLDLTSVTNAAVTSGARTAATDRGTVNAVLAFFELELTPELTLTTDPHSVPDGSSWRLPVWVLGSPFEVVPGDQIDLVYHRVGGPDWISAKPA